MAFEFTDPDAAGATKASARNAEADRARMDIV
jgi:hypothetical protein